MNNFKNSSKRGLALLLALVMCVSMLGTAAFAEEAEDEQQDDVNVVSCTMGEDCEAETHEEGCPKYVAPEDGDGDADDGDDGEETGDSEDGDVSEKLAAFNAACGAVGDAEDAESLLDALDAVEDAYYALSDEDKETVAEAWDYIRQYAEAARRGNPDEDVDTLEDTNSEQTEAEKLQTAINEAADGVETTITMTADITGMTTAEIITIPAEKVIVLDMEGHSITVAEGFSGRPIDNKGTLTVQGNGTIDSSASRSGYGAIRNDGTLTIQNGTYIGSVYGDGAAIRNGIGSKLTVNDGYFAATGAIYNVGEATIYKGEFVTLACSGCGTPWAYALNNRDESGASGKMDILPESDEDVRVHGPQGALASVGGAEVYVQGGTFYTEPCEKDHTGSTFYALYVSGKAGMPAKCVVDGGSFSTTGSNACVYVENNNTSDNGGEPGQGILEIHGGSFDHGEKAKLFVFNKNYGSQLAIDGGTFSKDDDISAYLAPSAVQGEDGIVRPRTEDDEDAVAKIDSAVYTTLQAAIEACPKNGTVTLLKDLTVKEMIRVEKDVTLDLNSYTIDGGCQFNADATEVAEENKGIGSTVLAVFNSTVTIKNGTVTGGYGNNKAGGIYALNSELTLTDVHVDKNFATAYGGGMFVEGTGSLTITGGSISDNKVGGTTTQNAGGLYIKGWNDNPPIAVVMTDVTVSGNKAPAYGGGIRTWRADMTLNNVTVTDNESWFGGGILLGSDTNLVMNGGAITDNRALGCSGEQYGKGAGAGMYIDRTRNKAALNGVTVTGNTAGTEYENFHGEGGGIFVSAPAENIAGNYTTLVLGTDNTIKNNTSYKGESNIYVCEKATTEGDVPEDESTPVTPKVPITGVNLSQSEITLVPGGTAPLTATVVPENTTDVNKTVTWISSDPAVATVVEGTVTAVAEGTATITAAVGSVSATCTVTVRRNAADVTISASRTRLSGGGAVTLTVSGPEGTTVSSNPSVTISRQNDGTYTATLPNSTAAYTFTASFAGDAATAAANASVTVNVTRYTSGGGGGGGTLVVPATPPVTPPEVEINDPDVPLAELPLPFTDVEAGAWFREPVAYVYSNSLMKGVEETRFAPAGATNRGMIATMLYRMEKEPSAASAAAFSDVLAGSWYKEAVDWGAGVGIITGYSDGRYGPEEHVTREQLAAILYRYAQMKGCDVSARADLSKFADSGEVSGYAAEAMSWAVSAGLLQGTTDTTLSPRGDATRAQVATIVMRLCENVLPKA